MLIFLLVTSIGSAIPSVSVGISGLVPIQTQNLLYGHGMNLAVDMWTWHSWVALRAEAHLFSYRGAYDYRVQMATLGPAFRIWTPMAQVDFAMASAWVQRHRGEGKESGQLLGYGLGLSWQVIQWTKLNGEVGARLWVFPGRQQDFRAVSVDLSVKPKF